MTIVTNNSKQNNSRALLRSDLAIILEKITSIEKEICELKNIPHLNEKSRYLNGAKLTPLQEEILRVLGYNEMTSEEVAKAINRTRPLMVLNLNQLVALGHLEKERKGKRIYFKQRHMENISERHEVDGTYLIVVFESNSNAEDKASVTQKISEHLKDIADWRVEHLTIVPKALFKDKT